MSIPLRSHQYVHVQQSHNIIEDYLAELDDQEQQHQQEQHHRLNNSRVYTPTDSGATAAIGSNGSGVNRTHSQELHDADVESAHAQQLRAQKQHEAAAHYYTEVANILQSIEKTTELYDRHKLRSQVSRALSQQYARNEAAAQTQPKKVSFDGGIGIEAAAVGADPAAMGATITLPSPRSEERGQLRHERNQQHHNHHQHQHNHHHRLSAPPVSGAAKEFTTPPNSPNISVAQLRLEQKQKKSVDQEKLDKIQSNRFKRLQIQWELLSKEAQVLQEELGCGDGGGAAMAAAAARCDLEMDDAKESRSGGSTPTSAAAVRSRIPRPVSYPATK